MSLQLVIVQVKSEDPVDKFIALNDALASDNFFGEVRLKYEAGVIRRAVIEENVKF